MTKSSSNYGISTNKNGGLHVRGKSYDLCLKVKIGNEYQKNELSTRAIAKKFGVGQTFVQKVIKEIDTHGCVLDPVSLQNTGRPIGPGVRTLDKFDIFVLIYLYLTENSRSLKSYKEKLFSVNKTIVSTSVICLFFEKGCRLVVEFELLI